MRVAVVSKEPSERFFVGFKYSAQDLANDAEISDVQVSIELVQGAESDDLIAVGAPQVNGYSVSVMIGEGHDGNEYYVKFTTTTSKGQVYEDKVFVKVRA